MAVPHLVFALYINRLTLETIILISLQERMRHYYVSIFNDSTLSTSYSSILQRGHARLQIQADVQARSKQR